MAIGQAEHEPDDADDGKLPLGVLFVHGMGSAKQGATLRQHGEPLVGWLARGTLRFGRAELVDVAMMPGDDEPARLTCELFDKTAATEPDGRMPETRWLLAESHWAQTFKAPTYVRIVAWLIGSVPWMLGEYVRNSWGRERTRRLRVARYFLVPIYALVGTILAGPIILLLALLVPLQYAAVGKARAWAGKLPRALSASLGDVYIILATHVDREAIRARIIRDHAWLTARCRRTVIVAHSAGSALTHQLIRDGRLNCDVYVTLGEAIWRMRWMRQLSDMPFGRRLAALGLALLGFVLWVAAVVLGVLHESPWLTVGGWVASAIVHTWSALLVWNERDAPRARVEAIDRLIVDKTPRVERWHDYVGSSDPVPGGVLASAQSGPRAFYEPSWIRNTRSIVFDHITYPHNLEEYVAGLGADLAAADTQLAPGPLITEAMAAEGKVGRVLRTLALALSRLGSAIVAIALLCALSGADQAGLQRLGDRIPWTAETLTKAIHKLPGNVTLDPRFAAKLVGVTIAVAVVAAAWVAVYLGWKAWDGKDRKLFMRRKSPIGVTGATPIASLAARAAGPRSIDMIFAAWWLTWSAGAVVAVLLLAEREERCALPAVTLLVGTLLMTFARPIARARDNAYAHTAPPP